ncbi:alpha/beta hydrolase [soil metagenome]
MLQPREQQIAVAFEDGSYPLNFLEWGDASNRNVLFCAHGFSRNSHDFDRVAESLHRDYRIICPDYPGRGKSGWLRAEAYSYQTTVAASLALLRHLEIDKVDWLGTSMGGVIGIMIGAQPESPIQKLVLNDVGPYFSKEALRSVAEYTGNDERFKDLAQAELHLRELYAAFGELPDAEWEHITRHAVSLRDDGTFGLAYDPNIAAVAKQYIDVLQDVEIWPLFEAVACPVLVMRGAISQVLSAEVVEQMKLRGKRVKAVEIPGVGHAPALRVASELAILKAFLLSD